MDGSPADKPKTTKATRRATQRAANAGRAEKMRKFRLDAPTAADRTPPPDVNVGCSGWFYWDWKGSFYPSQMPTNQWFGHYAEHFDTVEINASFYAWPTVVAVRKWREPVEGRDFRFSVKVSELITHVRRFEDVRDLIRDFGYVADLLGPHMGCLLYQLPASFTYSPARLEAIVSQIEPGRRNVVEFRHDSWWDETVFQAFRDAGITFCTASGPNLPDTVVKTADDLYVRFHGAEHWYRDDYDAAALDGWTACIAAVGAERVWAYFNNTMLGHAIGNAQNLRQRLIA